MRPRSSRRRRMPRVLYHPVPVDRNNALPAQGHDDDLLRGAAHRNSGIDGVLRTRHPPVGEELQFNFIHDHNVRQRPNIGGGSRCRRGVEQVQGLGRLAPLKKGGDRAHRNLRLADQHIARANGRFGNRGSIERRIGAGNHDDRVFTRLIDENHRRAGRRVHRLERAGDTVLQQVRPQFLPEGVFAHAAHQGRGGTQFGRRHRLVGALAPRMQGKALARHGFTGLWQTGHAGH